MGCRWRLELPRETAWRELCQETNCFFDADHSLITRDDELIAVSGISGGYNLFVVDAPQQLSSRNLKTADRTSCTGCLFRVPTAKSWATSVFAVSSPRDFLCVRALTLAVGHSQ